MTSTISKNIILKIASDKMTFEQAYNETGLKKNALFRALAKAVMAGDAPIELLDKRSIRSIYDTLKPVNVIAQENGNEVAKLNKRLRELNEKTKRLEEALTAKEESDDFISGIAEVPCDPPAWLNDSLDHLLDGRESVPMLLLGDWHYGEVVNPRTSGGYEFNAEIAEKRIEETVKKTIDMCRTHLSGLRYPGIVVGLIGDMTSGALHPELAESDEFSAFEAVVRARDLIVATLRTLADEFGKVFVPTAVGNHGRLLDRKPRAKGYAERNTDWLIYRLVQKEFENDPRVQIQIEQAGESVFRVYGKTFLLTHGDRLGSKGGDGIMGALGPIARGAMKTTKSLTSLGIDVDHVIMGHWHQSLYLHSVTVNGALKGPDEYAMAMLRVPAEDPSQTLLMVHPVHGITFRQPIFLKDDHCPDRRKSAVSDKWLEVFA